MFRAIIGASRIASKLAQKSSFAIQNAPKCSSLLPARRNFSSVVNSSHQSKLLDDPRISSLASNIVSRNVTKFSFRTGKRKTVKVVLNKFYRLNWGIWIRTKVGRQKKLWKKTSKQKRRLRQHVFCNATQRTMLDKMVTSFWKRPKHYPEDPYNPYHSREEYKFTARKPRPYFPPESES